MYHLTRTLAFIALVVVGVLGAGAFVALAQSTPSSQRSAGGMRSTQIVTPTPPPLPLGDQSRSLGRMRSTNVPDANTDALSILAHLPQNRGAMTMRPYTGPRPQIPKLTDLLKHKVRRIRSASGASIVLTGTSATPFLDDQTLPWGAYVFWLCQNLKPSTKYQYVVFPPDGTAYVLNARDYNGPNPPNPAAFVAQWVTDTQGRCLHNRTSNNTQAPWYGELALQTPIAGNLEVGPSMGATRAAGADNPYSGVWTIAVQNVQIPAAPVFEAMAYSVVIGTLNFKTYSNAGFTTPATDFASGSTVYVSASGLNPAHYYAFGFVNTSGSNLPCVAAIPAGSQNNNNVSCFIRGSGGIVPLNGTVSGQWTAPANSVGTYAVQLYDTTTDDLISTQQIALNPSTLVWSSLVPLNGATPGTNLGDIFATDGIINVSASGAPVAEQSVTGLQYAATGVVSGRQYQINVSNGNGVILNSATTDTTPSFGSPQALATQAPFTAASTSTGNQRVDFPINTALSNLTAFGATQTPFAPNVYTAQLFDMTSQTVVGSKSFTVVSYAGQFQWTTPAGSYVNVAAANGITNVTTTLRNTAGTLYGNWNGDGIKSITITNDLPAGAVKINRQAGVNTTTDSLGQLWNITAPVANTITLTPNTAGQFLPINATIPIPIAINAAAGTCTTGCTLRTSITPLHGINGSTMDPTMTNRATNGLLVYANGVVGTNVSPTYSWQVGAYSGAQIVPAIPRYRQMLYDSGTNQAVGGTYTFVLTVTNNGAPSKMHMLELVMPATVNPNTQVPVLTSAVINGATQTTHWHVYTQNGVGGQWQDGNLPNNGFSLQAIDNNATTLLNPGQTATFTFTMPIPLASFPFQEIAATANIDDLNGAGGGSYSVGPNNTLTNAPAGTNNIDSTELGVFSLATSLMSMTLTPPVVASLPGQSTVLKFVNTSTGLDPNPDYVSQLIFTVPTNPVPTSVTVTSPNQAGVTWYANPVIGNPGTFHVELCTPDSGIAAGSAPCGAIDSNSLPPGAELDMTINWAVAPAVANNIKIPWTVTGANGNAQATATAAQQPSLTVANTTALVSFTYAGGYGGPPAGGPPPGLIGVPANTQAQVGAWSNFANGNGFVYELKNNGSTPITDVAIAIPSSATGSGQITDAQDWQLIPSSIYVYGAGSQGATCSANGYQSLLQPVRGSPGTPGLLRLSGCNIPVNGTFDVFFYSLSPYDVGSTFTFPANVANGSSPAIPTPANMNTTTPGNNTLADTVRIISNARLVIAVPNAGAYAGPFYGGAVPAISCPGCTYTAATNLVNLNNITGTVSVNDVMAATVYSDDTSGWSLSVNADVNYLLPANKQGQLSTWVSPSPRSSARAGFTIAATAATVVPTNPGAPLALSSYNGAVSHNPLDNLMNYTVTLDPLSVPNAGTTLVTLTYTLIAN
jgi:hypothetical protein